MKIGVLTTSLPRFAGDHCGQFVDSMCRALQTRGHHVHVLAPQPAESTAAAHHPYKVDWVPYLRPRRLQQTFYGDGAPDNLGRSYLARAGALGFVPMMHRRAHTSLKDADALISHWSLPCGLIAARAAKRRPHLCVAHSGDVHLLEQLPGKRRLGGSIAAGTSAFWFVSRDLQQRFLRHAPDWALHRTTHVGPMGVEAPPLTKAIETPLEGPLRVLVLARLVPIKGVDVALRALAELQDTELVVAGDGSARDALQALSEELGCNARFVGMLHGDEKWRALARADVCVVPSVVTARGRTEGLPTVILEAMAVGTAVVASRSGGIPEVVRHGENGLLVDPGSVVDLRQALQTLRDDRTRREQLTRAGLETAAQHRWPAVAQKVEELLINAPD